MNTKETIIQEIEEITEPLLTEILDFVRFLKVKQLQEEIENQQDLEDARVSLAEAKEKGTISLKDFKQELGL
ncbi:DUF2281 domain-containing protein [Rivularia sp. UHCC 0363]|jgi:hypothetical protein|uniref:DUF2281 domain-containing protein n=1 Tax=Rivularia sp. UHCC 0363 TaxID=3110244 RepID=UPI002B1FDFCA|nr:hypothetical protein [Rivularia sp. UHCC 0363]MEA5598804.1 hypothetical protein [Rivularia sp. UHCC 0363]